MNGTSEKGVNIMAFLYLITAILDLIVCILYGIRAISATTNFGIGISIFCAICWGICFILNLLISIDKFKDK